MYGHIIHASLAKGHHFVRHSACTFICDQCLASQMFPRAPAELNFTDFRDDAVWMHTLMSHDVYVAASTADGTVSPWVHMPGWRLGLNYNDGMHNEFIGFCRDMSASLLYELLGFCMRNFDAQFCVLPPSGSLCFVLVGFTLGGLDSRPQVVAITMGATKFPFTSCHLMLVGQCGKRTQTCFPHGPGNC
jgi:hypothetical protein